MKEGHIFTSSQIDKGYVNFLKDQIGRVGAFDKLVHHITSPGGDVYEGYDAYHFLRSLGKPIKTIVEGQCQSIATLIASAGDEIVMLNPSRWMIHEASIPPMGISGTADVLERGSQELRKINSEMAERYSAMTGKPIQEILEVMKKETPMTAQEAKDFGFAQEVVNSIGDMKKYETLKAVALGNNYMPETKIEQLISDGLSRIEALFKKTAVAVSPVAIDLAGADGKMYNVASENGEDLVNKSITVDGGQVNDGTIPLADGRALVVKGGVVTSVTEAMTPEQKELQQLREQVKTMQAEKAAMEAAKQTVETQLQTTNSALQEIQKEVTALKKMAVGNQNPAARGGMSVVSVANKEQESVYKELHKEILQKAGLLN